MLAPSPTPANPAAALCDELHAAGFFAHLLIDVSGRETLSFAPIKPRAQSDEGASGTLAELSDRFRTESQFAAGMAEYLHDCGAVYALVPKAEPRAAAA